MGFKILLDLVASPPTPVRFTEVPFTFRARQQGKSKLDINVGLEYLYLVGDKLVGPWLPIRFILFCIVGTLGVGFHLGVLYLLYQVLGFSFGTALITAVGTAMVINFAINNATTYRDQRRRGWDFVTGLFFFILACSVGGLCNYVIPSTSVPGSVVAACWILRSGRGFSLEFAVTSVLSWRVKSRA